MEAKRARFVLAFLVLGSMALSAQSPSCPPPDSAFISAWLAQPEPDLDFGTAHSGVIAIAPKAPTASAELVAAMSGAYRAYLYSAMRPDRVWLQDTLYLTLHVPTTREAHELQRRDALRAPPDLVGYGWGVDPTRLERPRSMSPWQLLGWRDFLGGVSFGHEPDANCEDCGGLSIARTEPWGLSGWWSSGGAVVPESLGWFCAYRVVPRT